MTSSLEKNDFVEATCKKRLKPGLKLNTDQAHVDEKKIHIRKNSFGGCYFVENHPQITDTSKSATDSRIAAGCFFNSKGEESSYSGAYYYVLERSNGKEMQDRTKAMSLNSESNITFFGVYDGHSTQHVPEMAAQKLDQYIIEALKTDNNMILAIQKAFVQIEDEVNSYLKKNNTRGGTTALCTILQQRKLYAANLGDSRAVIFQKKGFSCLSKLHDLSNESERLLVEQKGGIILKNRIEGELAVTRSFGDIRFKAHMSSEPEICLYEIKDDDEYLLIGTDGYWNGLDPELTLKKIQDFKRITESKGLTLKRLGDYLMDEACLQIKTKKDNMALIVVSIKDYLLHEEKS